MLPLSEGIIPLLAPDPFTRSATWSAPPLASDSVPRRWAHHRPSCCSHFVGLVPQARFSPEDVNLASGGQLYRPIGIVPITPGWGSYQLEARAQASAIYLFDEGITFREDLTVSYQNRSSTAWSRSVRILDQERARVRGRATAGTIEPS